MNSGKIGLSALSSIADFFICLFVCLFVCLFFNLIVLLFEIFLSFHHSVKSQVFSHLETRDETHILNF